MKSNHMNNNGCVPSGTAQVSIFLTDMGWFGFWGVDQVVWGLTIGHASEQNVRDIVLSKLYTDGFNESDWFPDLRTRLQRFASGIETEFSDISVRLPSMTKFQERVILATRKIPYGKTLSYGELANKAGSPRAARAVGNVMRSNRFPVIVPCHRVIASGGRLGGFTAPQGTDLKQQMLQLESDEWSSS